MTRGVRPPHAERSPAAAHALHTHLGDPLADCDVSRHFQLVQSLLGQAGSPHLRGCPPPQKKVPERTRKHVARVCADEEGERRQGAGGSQAEETITKKTKNEKKREGLCAAQGMRAKKQTRFVLRTCTARYWAWPSKQSTAEQVNLSRYLCRDVD